MALVCIGDGKYKDTDDLSQEEYYYYCKLKHMAQSLPYDDLNYRTVNRYRRLAANILLGNLRVSEIETNPEYEWLKD